MFSRTGAAAALLITALTAGLIAPAAGAQEASFRVTEEGVTGADLDDVFTTLTALGRLADTVVTQTDANTGAAAGAADGLPEGSSDAAVILDPFQALLEMFSVVSLDSLGDLGLSLRDSVSIVHRMSPVRGQTAEGATVVFPTSGRFTSGYGARWGTTHEGIDIADPVGTPVLAVMDGTVISAGPARGFGQWVRVRHDDGSVSVYGHVHSIHAEVGQRVTAGDQIATIGNEGQSTGPHLHFEIRPGGGGPVNPVNWFAQQGITVR